MSEVQGDQNGKRKEPEATEILQPGGAQHQPVADTAEDDLASSSTDSTEILSQGTGGGRDDRGGTRTPTTVAAPAGTILAQGLPGKFGRYEILEEIAHGGMGIVYKARDPELNRIVALKVMVAGEAASAELIQRFHVEAQAAARLRYPHIVSIHEVGVAEGLHYFTMDFVDGESLLKAIREEKLALPQSLEVLEKTARAVHYAHGEGIIHRDLKPGNVLLDKQGEPQVTDFGLAKDIETDFSLTQSGAAMGTPAYMSPEQARGDRESIDARSDVYSLGAMLYEMVTGRPPFTADHQLALLLQVAREDPVPPRRLNASLDREVETICLKCLAKEPERRYQAAGELADDIRRHLNHEPIEACPSSVWYRTKKRVLRNKAVAAVSALALMAVIALTLGWIVTLQHQAREAELAAIGERTARRQAEAERAEAQRQEGAARRAAEAERSARELAAQEKSKAEAQAAMARRERNSALREAYFANVALAKDRILDGHVAQGEKLLDSCPEQLRFWEWGYLKRLCHLDLMTLKGHQDAVSSVAFSPDGRRIASASHDQTVKVWDAETGREVAELRGHRDHVTCVAFSPDGKRIASASGDKTVKVWDTEAAREVMTLEGRIRVHCVAFSPDGKRIASAGWGGTVRVWDGETGREIMSLKGRSPVDAVAFSPDGKRIVSGSRDFKVRVWDGETGREVMTLEGHRTFVFSLAFSPDGERIASASGDKTVKVWDTETGREVMTLEGHRRFVFSVAFSPDGEQIASGSEDNTVRVWDGETGRQILTLRGHGDDVHSVAFGPDSERIVSGSGDNTVRVWREGAGCEVLTWEGGRVVKSVAFSPDGRLVASGSHDHTVKLWDAETGREVMTLKGHSVYVDSVVFSPDGRRIASGSLRTVEVWDVETGREVMALTGHGSYVSSIAFSPDGKRMVSGSRDRAVKVWDAETGREVMTLKGQSESVSSVSFSPDGKRIAWGSGRTVKVWDAETGREVMTLGGHRDLVFSIAFSPDGKRMASGGLDKTVIVWDMETGGEVLTLTGHSSGVCSVAFSPDGKRIVSGSRDWTLMVWDTATGREVMTLRGHDSAVSSVAFSPDGKRIASGSLLTVKVWDAREPPGAAEVLLGVPRGEARALFQMALIEEREHRDAEARALLQRAAAATDPVQKEWAEKSKWRLENMPWLKE